MISPLVSIVTPCYNGENYISRFLDAILNQTYKNIELVIIDDGSDDRTAEIIKEYSEVLKAQEIKLIYEYQENAGQAAALNRGLKLVSGDYITWMDSDDTISSNFIEARVEYLQLHKETAFCYGKAEFVSEEDPSHVISVFEKRDSKSYHSFFEDVLFSKDVFFSGYTVRKTALDQAIPHREIYVGPGGQNAQLLIPLGWYYGEPGYVENSIYYYYIRSNSHSHSIDTSYKIIQQFYNYENIILNTLNKIPDQDIEKYKILVRNHYSQIRFGNAVDTKDGKLIGQQYKELKRYHIVTVKNFLLHLKYTNKLMRWILRVDEM